MRSIRRCRCLTFVVIYDNTGYQPCHKADQVDSAIEEGLVAMSENDVEWVEGSGNVFRDFGDPHADLKQAKAILAARIIAVLDNRGLTVRKAGAMTGFAAADFSRIRNANLGRFTLDRLMKMLAALDDSIRVVVQVDAGPVTDAAVQDLRSEP